MTVTQSVRMQALRAGLLVVAAVVAVGRASGAGPMAHVKETTERILRVVSDPANKGEANDSKRRKLVREIVDERFDWAEMAQRSLARNWRKADGNQQQRFVVLFGDLLEQNYMSKIESYSGEEVMYDEEKIDGDYGQASIRIITGEGTEIPVTYRLRDIEGRWLVYDISVAGVSLVNNYRSQFNSLLRSMSFDKMLERLEKKTASAGQ